MRKRHLLKNTHFHVQLFFAACLFQSEKKCLEMDSALASGPRSLRRLQQGSSCTVCPRRPLSGMIACLFVACLRHCMLMRVPPPPITSPKGVQQDDFHFLSCVCFPSELMREADARCKPETRRSSRGGARGLTMAALPKPSLRKRACLVGAGGFLEL